jgi:hypothetical protein
MVLFSFFWVPVFYFFWKSIAGGQAAGGIWALVFGVLTALFQYFTGSLIYPGTFGLLRWLSAFVDLVVFPVLLPLGVSLIMLVFHAFSGALNLTNFLLVWLIPLSIFRALGLGDLSPLETVFVPLLWTGLAVGMPFFIETGREFYGVRMVLALAGSAVLPLAGSTAYWAFFSGKPFLAFFLTALTMLPMLSSVAVSFIRTKKHGKGP